MKNLAVTLAVAAFGITSNANATTDMASFASQIGRKIFDFGHKPAAPQKTKITFEAKRQLRSVAFMNSSAKKVTETGRCALSAWESSKFAEEKKFGKLEGTAFKAHLRHLMETGQAISAKPISGCEAPKDGRGVATEWLIPVMAYTTPADVNNITLVCLFTSSEGQRGLNKCIQEIDKIDNAYE